MQESCESSNEMTGANGDSLAGGGVRVGAPWMSRALWAAGFYNVCWGVAAVAWPSGFCQWLGLYGISYVEIWQYVGLLLGIYGVAYMVAATGPLRHWPVVAIGLLTKIFGPIGFIRAAFEGRLPWQFGWTVLANDFIWWVPFGAILVAAYRYYVGSRRIASPEVQEFALRVRTNAGESLLEMSRREPVLLYFLRHTGCPFCRESLAGLATERARLESSGTRLVFVHMSSDAHAGRFLARYKLDGVPRVSDRNRTLYRAFGLGRGNLWQLVGPQLWWRGIVSIWRNGQSLSPKGGDIFQLPGIFLVFHGIVVRSFIHQTAADNPDFIRFSQGASLAENQA